MMVLEQIENLKSQGVYNGLLRSGVISLKIDFYFEIYKYYLEVCKEKNTSSRDAIFIASEKFKVCEGTVYNAVRFMKR